MEKDNITILIYTHNEENNIEACIRSSLTLTKNIILIDMESDDRTVSLAERLGVIVYNFPFSSYVEPAREFGIDKTNTDWVFILDADERVTQKLTLEVNKVIKSDQFSYYKIPRKNIFARIQWLRYGGWWPDYQIRLINKKFFKSWPKEIHSTPIINGPYGFLEEPLLHFFHGDIEKMVEKTVIFEDIESELLFKAGRPVTIFTFFRKFLGELYRRLVKGRGFMDGEIGIIESVYQAFSKTITYLYLYEKKNRSLRSLS